MPDSRRAITASIAHPLLAVLLFLSLNLHLLRNISIAYLAIPGMLFAFLIAEAVPGLRLSNPLSRTYAAFLVWSVYVVVISPLRLGASDLAAASARLFFVLPLAIVVQGLDKDSTVRRFLIVYAAVAAVGCATLPLQFFTGPVGWFAETSSRAGFDRYASLFGNLTAVGIVGGIGLIVVLLLRMNRILKAIFVTAIVVGMMLSLQKAAIMNLLVVVAVYSWHSGSDAIGRARKLVLAVLLVCVVVGPMVWVAGSVATASLDNVFRFGSHASYDDYTVTTSIGQRLWELPGVVYDEYGTAGVLAGAGLIGGGGTLGMPDAPQSHNSFFDLVFTGGVLYAFLFGRLLWLCLVRIGTLRACCSPSANAIRANNFNVLSGALAVFAINLPFNSGIVFQPNECILFWLTVGLLAGPYGGEPERNELHGRLFLGNAQGLPSA